MATSKTLELSIKIAGRMDKSLTAAINGTQSKIGSLTKSISNIGTVGLATMGAVATAAAVGIADCTKEAQALESSMAPVVRYVDGLADASGAVSDAIADNGKTFKQNYGALKTYIQDLSTDIPRTTDQLTAMSAALGQSGIGVDKQLTTGYLRDTAVAATAMDLDDQTAGNYVAKWEASFNFDHKQVMELMDQINYLGAHNATTAAEIAQSVNSAASMGQIAGVDPAATAAMATAMQATGVATDRVGTSIYKYIAKGLFLNLTQEELPRHGKKKHKYKKVKKNKSASRAPAGESIEQRPEEIDEREEFGHWEGDTVYSGKGKRKTTRALLTLTERKTRKEIIIAIPNRKAETVVKALDALERKLGARRFRAIFKSITFDNGTEFAAAEELERSCINKHLPRTKVYFCHPYSSWERGTNENTNGMIRRRFPKGTNFAAVTNAQITQAENWINNYPRKILGYKSSEIVFRECLRELGIAA